MTQTIATLDLNQRERTSVRGGYGNNYGVNRGDTNGAAYDYLPRPGFNHKRRRLAPTSTPPAGFEELRAGAGVGVGDSAGVGGSHRGIYPHHPYGYNYGNNLGYDQDIDNDNGQGSSRGPNRTSLPGSSPLPFERFMSSSSYPSTGSGLEYTPVTARGAFAGGDGLTPGDRGGQRFGYGEGSSVRGGSGFGQRDGGLAYERAGSRSSSFGNLRRSSSSRNSGYGQGTMLQRNGTWHGNSRRPVTDFFDRVNTDRSDFRRKRTLEERPVPEPWSHGQQPEQVSTPGSSYHMPIDLSSPDDIPPAWQPDSEVDSCPICETPFTFWYRKHHCRSCGQVVCADCSPHRIPLPRHMIARPPHQFPPVDEPGEVDSGDLEVRVCTLCVPVNPDRRGSHRRYHSMSAREFVSVVSLTECAIG